MFGVPAPGHPARAMDGESSDGAQALNKNARPKADVVTRRVALIGRFS
jgi:hypothetical protein